MSKTLILATLLLAGCAHRNVDPNFYDYQWAKAGATEEQWKRDSHECDEERDQRAVNDKLAVTNQRALAESMCGSNMAAPGCINMDWGGGASKQAAENYQRYWPECMEARSWKMVGRKVTGASADTRTFKP